MTIEACFSEIVFVPDNYIKRVMTTGFNCEILKTRGRPCHEDGNCSWLVEN